MGGAATVSIRSKAGTRLRGDLNVLSTMVNAYYDFNTGTPFTPYLGAGIGDASLMAKGIKNKSTGDKILDNNALVFAYQGIAGVSYALNDHIALNADYRYFGTTQGKIKEPYGDKAKLDYQSQSILVGFTYKFGVPTPPAPAPVAAPAPAPRPVPPAPVVKPVTQAPITKSYLVFFDFNKSDITPEANKIILQAANNAKTEHATSIQLTGHTDAAGSVKFNQALSLRRAEAVKAVLVRLGVPASEISVIGKGKSEPLVPTKDGVREPQNRRVQILLP